MDQSDLLPFFPESFPDETFWSRVSRYHLLTGHSGEDTTYRELFGKRVQLEFIVPAAAIEALASLLPGQVEDTTGTLVRENTLLPAFSPFLGNDGQPVDQEISVGAHYDGLGRIPKRVVGEHGEHRLCLSCLNEDIALHGTGYWHRSHQVPGVRVCWKHGEMLLTNCQVCRRPVSRLKSLLSLPWRPCKCGWSPAGHRRSADASEAEKRYAGFAHDLIETNLAPIQASQLRDGFITKLRKTGFAYGERDIAPNAIREAIETEYGTEFINDIDPAYANGLRNMWLRFNLINGQIEMPIMRFILVSMFLFQDVEDFAGHMARTPVPQATPHRKRVAFQGESAVPPVDEKRQKEMRGKLLQLQVKFPNITLDHFWKKAYRVADWLYEHDKAWLLSTIRHHSDEAALATPSIDDAYNAEDMALAKKVDGGIDALYAAEGKPRRVGAEVIRAIAGTKLHPTKTSRGRYPLAHARVERYKESYWHFAVRRFIYGIAEIRRHQVNPLTSVHAKLSGLHATAATALHDHFHWNLEIMASATYDLKGELARLGISRQWEGPPGADDIRYGGRRHKKLDAA